MRLLSEKKQRERANKLCLMSLDLVTTAVLGTNGKAKCCEIANSVAGECGPGLFG